MIIITNTIMIMRVIIRLQMIVIINNSIIVSMCVCFYANTREYDAATAVACPEKTKVNFHATHMCNMAKLNNNNNGGSGEQTVASACGSCHTLHAVVVAIIEAQRWRCCGFRCYCCCLLNATFVGSFCCVDCVKNMCRCTPTFVARCALPPPAFLSLRCPLHILCMFNELPQNLLPQIDAGCQLQVATVTGTGKRRWKVKMRVTVTGSWSCLSLSLSPHLFLSMSISPSPSLSLFVDLSPLCAK